MCRICQNVFLQSEVSAPALLVLNVIVYVFTWCQAFYSGY